MEDRLEEESSGWRSQLCLEKTARAAVSFEVNLGPNGRFAHLRTPRLLTLQISNTI